ncbi:SHOCT domain-containing protein [Streptomyces sp. BR123]|uniref:SHOCT domain-containing protein n=1 Tax=Streptomyces sp. BR123 TaxID=2749828 RepID=UPI0015C48ADD|nr:SHOCT domain-containing protein [Streptomyces sp. BR123]NXY95720.1 SHOCT domain-containing protein [Streptomyces sp. BR123]
MYWNGHMGPWGWLAMSLTALVFWALIIAAAVLVARSFKRDGAAAQGAAAHAAPAPRAASAEGAETLLAERYAKGEIDDEEYARRLAVLRGHAPGPAPP